jgi:hypothetical protein
MRCDLINYVDRHRLEQSCLSCYVVAYVAHLDRLEVCFSPDEKKIGAEVSVFATLIDDLCHFWLTVDRLKLRVAMLCTVWKKVSCCSGLDRMSLVWRYRLPLDAISMKMIVPATEPV